MDIKAAPPKEASVEILVGSVDSNVSQEATKKEDPSRRARVWQGLQGQPFGINPR